MKKTSIIAIGALVVAGLFLTSAVLAGVGNELPSGKHYNLNIHATKNVDDVGNSMGHTMFVKFYGITKIFMTQTGGKFEVTDREGLTDSRTEFNIAPGAYDVYARPLGSPKGNPKVDLTAYYSLINDAGEIYLGQVPDIYRERGKPKTYNLRKLFYLSGEWIFDVDDFEYYYWEYDNKGLKLLQVRFYLNESYQPPA